MDHALQRQILAPAQLAFTFSDTRRLRRRQDVVGVHESLGPDQNPPSAGGHFDKIALTQPDLLANGFWYDNLTALADLAHQHYLPPEILFF
jgi:hypothetical protein